MAKIFEIGSGRELPGGDGGEDAWARWLEQLGETPLSAGLAIGWTADGDHLMIRSTDGLTIPDMIAVMEMAKHIMLTNSYMGEFKGG